MEPRFFAFQHTRRVVLPTRCYYREQQRSGDLRQFAYEFWMLAQDTDKDGSLVVGLLTVLFPVFKGRRLGMNGLDKHLLGHLQLFLQCDDFRTSRGFDWRVFDPVVTQRTLALTCCCQIIEPLD